jgi:hypothetical protein
VNEAKKAMSAVKRGNKGVGMRLIVRHAHGLQEEGDDIKTERGRPAAQSVSDDLDACSKCQDGAESEEAD